MKDYYKTLGISPLAESEVITAAYKALMRKYHPDASCGSDTVHQAQALNEAYRCLRNPARRSAYDALRASKVASPFPRPPRPPRPSPPHRRTPSSREPKHVGKSPALAFVRTVLGVVIAATFVSAIWGATDREESAALSTSEINAFGAVEDSFVPAVRVELVGPDSFSPSERSAVSEGMDARVPTNEEFKAKVAIAVEDFARVHGESGLAGAQEFSVDCHRAARPMNDILWTDYCVAFDVSAWTLDRALNDQFDTPPSSYFANRMASYQQGDDPFAHTHSQRTQIIQAMVAESLFRTLNRRKSLRSLD